MGKKALITGITGQDGSYLSELLLNKGYEVHGIIRRTSAAHRNERMWRLQGIEDDLQLHTGDITSFPSMYKLVHHIKPDETYHLAAQSHVHESFKDDSTTYATNIDGTYNLLASLKEFNKDGKFYFAATSELFGKPLEVPQNEKTPFYPVSPYSVAKRTGFDMTRMNRDAYNMFACSGILFNHESPRRGDEFVTRKITSAAARIKLGLQDKLQLGNLEAKRDWGYAGDYVEAMWMMLQQDKPDDYVIGTGETHTVKELVEVAFNSLGLKWQDHVELTDKFKRPHDVQLLLADPSKAKKELGWSPRIKFHDLVEMMIQADLDRYKK